MIIDSTLSWLSKSPFTFYTCFELASVIIPESVKSIGDASFSNCNGLTSVTNLSKTPQEIEKNTFTTFGDLHVLPGCKAAYEAADYWKNFNIIEDAVILTPEMIMDMIDAIGNVEHSNVCKAKIDDARSAYDALTKEQQALVKNYATILARALSIKGDLSDQHIKDVSSKVTIPPFVAKTVKIKVKDDEPDEPNVPGNEQEMEEAELNSLMKELSIYDKKKADPDKLIPEDFEKDDDTNGHIDFIHACSNLRAQNYKIKECDRQKTKMIAGKIIPAIATTTAAITGIVSLQLYTLYQTNKIDFLRDCYLNLAINSIFMSEPKPAIQMKDKDYDPILLGPVKAIPPNWTVWDKMVINKSMTVKELINYIKEKYEVEVSIITAGNVTIIQTFMPSSKARMEQKIEDIYNANSKVKLDDKTTYLNLEISGDIGDATALMPMFKYIFKN